MIHTCRASATNGFHQLQLADIEKDAPLFYAPGRGDPYGSGAESALPIERAAFHEEPAQIKEGCSPYLTSRGRLPMRASSIPYRGGCKAGKTRAAD